jgi:N-acetylneuraminate synthase/N,N'-diacetyllegionaminate synthase
MICLDACGNHEGKIELINSMIDISESLGTYIKFQAYRIKTLHPSWSEKYHYYETLELSNEQIWEIAHTKKSLFTVFDSETAEWLSTICKTVKIASPDANNWDLIRTCLDRFETVIISTGMHSDKEIGDLRRFAGKNAKLLYCISKYPTRFEDVDFDKMQYFDGFSDHTPDIRASMKALENGAQIIERHFTLCRSLKGNDQAISSTPDEIEKLVNHQRYLEKCEEYKIRWRG